MRLRSWNGFVRLVMAAAFLVTGYPLLRPWLPLPLSPHPAGAQDVQPALPGRIAVNARDTLTTAELQDLNTRFGLALQLNSPYSAGEKLLVGDVPPGQEEAVLAGLRKDPRVEAAGPMYVYHLPPAEMALGQALRASEGAAPSASKRSWTPNDPLFKDQWNMALVGAEKAWARTRGAGVTVAVIDTGVAFEADDKCYLARDFAGTPFAAGYDFVNHDKHPNDDQGHGTHVAGTIAETTDNGEGAAGLAFEARVMPIKVLDQWGSGTCADIADGIRYAADHGAQIINMSLGGPYPDQILRSACRYAAKKGVLIVCAAGNSGGGPVGYPAAFPECLAVSSVGPTGELAPYSSVGKEVAIAAPGGDKTRGEQYGILQNTVLTDANGERTDDYFAFQGTSMASPHVAAAAALAMSRGIKDPEAVKQLLQKAATPRKPAHQYGAGILNAGKAVEMADGARRDSWLKLLFTVIAGLTGLGVGGIRHRLSGLTRFPFAPLGFVMGMLGPDMIFGWMGFGSPFNIVLHSALIPLYLLWEAESGTVYRFVGAMAAGMAMHLGWDAMWGHAPFAGVLPTHAIPWLWVNAVAGLGVALVAYRRSFAGQ